MNFRRFWVGMMCIVAGLVGCSDEPGSNVGTQCQTSADCFLPQTCVDGLCADPPDFVVDAGIGSFDSGTDAEINFFDSGAIDAGDVVTATPFGGGMYHGSYASVLGLDLPSFTNVFSFRNSRELQAWGASQLCAPDSNVALADLSHYPAEALDSHQTLRVTSGNFQTPCEHDYPGVYVTSTRFNILPGKRVLGDPSHDLWRLPWATIGDAHGYFRTGRCINLPRHTNTGRVLNWEEWGNDDGSYRHESEGHRSRPHNDFFVSVANAMGIETNSFGATGGDAVSTGPITELRG